MTGLIICGIIAAAAATIYGILKWEGRL